MFVILLLSWWYGRGWFWLAGLISKNLKEINEAFSVGILLKTLFSPWKQIQSPTSFKNFIQASVDNLVSRFVGAAVRSLMLLGAFLSSAFVAVAGIAALIIWPLLPIAVFLVPIISLIKVGA